VEWQNFSNLKQLSKPKQLNAGIFN
jgi:hypothetical protein